MDIVFSFIRSNNLKNCLPMRKVQLSGYILKATILFIKYDDPLFQVWVHLVFSNQVFGDKRPNCFMAYPHLFSNSSQAFASLILRYDKAIYFCAGIVSYHIYKYTKKMSCCQAFLTFKNDLIFLDFFKYNIQLFTPFFHIPA